jgi:hypothetical protein
MRRERVLTSARLVLAASAVIIGLALLPAVSFGANPNPKILPPNSQSYGMTYSEWSARWWQWAISLPTSNSPLFDTADCSTGQIGPVWFLGGSFVSATDVRNCNVPFGKALFFPLVNNECSDLEAPPWYGATPQERRACAALVIDTVSDLAAEIDGVPVQDLEKYRVVSPNFYFTAPPDNLLGVPADTGQSVGDGYYLMVAPLSAGPHTIHFTATVNMFDFVLDITYYLNVTR